LAAHHLAELRAALGLAYDDDRERLQVAAGGGVVRRRRELRDDFLRDFPGVEIPDGPPLL